LTDLSDLLTAADALTQPIHHVERIYDRDRHRHRRLKRVWITNQPSLLDQLAAAVVPGEVYVEDQNGAKLVPRSIPPARLEAINALLMIEAGSVMWVVRVGLTVRETATDNIRALVGASMTSDDTTEALSDLRRWYGWAATLTGWEVPAWTPQAPCPICDERSLRVRLERKTATCVSCAEFWNEDTIGLLGDHVAAYDSWSRAEARAAREREAAAQRERAGQTRREVS
jgi:hypothetical protein